MQKCGCRPPILRLPLMGTLDSYKRCKVGAHFPHLNFRTFGDNSLIFELRVFSFANTLVLMHLYPQFVWSNFVPIAGEIGTFKAINNLPDCPQWKPLVYKNVENGRPVKVLRTCLGDNSICLKYGNFGLVNSCLDTSLSLVCVIQIWSQSVHKNGIFNTKKRFPHCPPPCWKAVLQKLMPKTRETESMIV